MNLPELRKNEPVIVRRLKRLERDAELYENRFREFSEIYSIPLISLMHSSNGVALIDVEYGVDALGLIQLAESSGKVNGSKITISEPIRSETDENQIGEIFDVYKEYSTNVGLDISIIRDYCDSVMGWNKFEAIFWLNMFPEFCDVDNLVNRLQKCKNNLISGGVALLTQNEHSMYEEERYEKVLERGLKEGLDIQLIESLGVLGNVGVLLRN